MIHALKIHPEYFEEVIAGRKTYEVRVDDRPFRYGDLLALNEYNPVLGTYTDNSCLVYVDGILRGDAYVREGFVIMSIKPCSVAVAGLDYMPSDYEVPYATMANEDEEEACARSTRAAKHEKQPTIIEIHGKCVEMMRENLYLAQCLTAALLGIGPTEGKSPEPRCMRDAEEVLGALAGQLHEELLRLIHGTGVHSL